MPSPAPPTSVPPSPASDALLLVRYLMRNGVSVSTETVTALENAPPDEDAASAADKAAFFAAYSEVAKLASPVTAASLRDCSNKYPTTFRRWPWSTPKIVSEAERAVLVHHTWAAIALITLLVVQIYWLIGATLISGIKRQDVHPSAPAAETTTTTPSPSPAAAVVASVAGEQDAREDTHVWLLSAWSALWRWAPDLYQRFFPDKDLSNNRFWELYIGTKFVLDILQTYVLPLLYGWVGAMAFVLRSLILAVKNRTFLGDLNVEYRLRVYLGLLAGLVIGWFLRPKGDTAQVAVANLAPAALSFVAGYSVEIMFSTMDRIVSGFVTAFGGSTVETPQKPRG